MTSSRHDSVTVTIARRTYTMPRRGYEALLEIAREKVPCGIYAIESRGGRYAELRLDRLSVAEMKRRRRELKRAGYKALCRFPGREEPDVKEDTADETAV